jgi:hypothetical protein
MEYRFYFLGSDCRIHGPSCGFMASDDSDALKKADAGIAETVDFALLLPTLPKKRAG